MPHSEIPGSPIARISPGLFAACHVLHRLSVPRHPPDALASRLITGIAVTGDAAPPPRTGPSPMPTPASAGGGGLYEDTSRTYPGPVLPAPGLSASVTAQLSLHPSINPRRGRPRQVAQSSPNVAQPPGGAGGASRCSCAAPVGRQSFALPVVEVNGFEPMTSCLQSRRSPG